MSRVPLDRKAPVGHALLQALLALAVLGVFSRVATFGFVQYDDPTYVTENARVLAGLSGSGIAWAFEATAAGNWHPLTWISLMLDATLGGGAPWLFHVTNVLLHLLNTLLLFRLLVRATDATGPSAVVAALFAIHPLHVESVAWVAERKDVLSTFFLLLALHAYVSHARRPSACTYALILIAFAASLLSKPMAVTLPVLLLLLDVWPLDRIAPGSAHARSVRRLVLEKLPLAALSAISAVVTLIVQSRRGAVGGFESFPPWTRVENAVVSTVAYLARMVWPARLALPYPYDLERLRAVPLTIAALVLAALTVLALRSWRKRPYLLVGWLWYLVSLLPVIGLVQVGSQSMADRYTYVPLIGIFVALAWLADDLARALPRLRRALAIAGVLALAALGARAYAQVGVWRDTVSLFRNALRVTGANPVAHNGLGLALQSEGHVEEAIDQYRRALRVSPAYVDARANLAAALIVAGRFDEAFQACEEMLAARPADATAQACMGAALVQQGRAADAVEHLEAALQLAPDNASAHVNLGLALSALGKDDQALPHFAEAARLRPNDAGLEVTIATMLLRWGNLDGAAAHFERALQLDPENVGALRNFGVLRARQGRIEEAERYFRGALRIDPTDEGTRRNLERVRALGSHSN